MVLERHPRNPILTRADIPDIGPDIADPSAVFNPGAVKRRGQYLLMLRVQTRGRRTFLLMASSENGVDFTVSRRPVRLQGIEHLPETIYHLYDPRLTRVGGTYYVMFAADTDGGCRLGVARSEDLANFELVGLGPERDLRNGVLFPEQREGRFMRLDRPNLLQRPGGPASGKEIRLSVSTDLIEWESVATVMTGRPYFWDELIGSGPPPIKTREGWLHVYHGVATHFGSTNIYQAGAVLLDLQDPSRVLARSQDNILEPREPYEQIGQVPNVVFPSGLVVDVTDDDGFAQLESRVWVYYGAADTSVALATTTVRKLLEACRD